MGKPLSWIKEDRRRSIVTAAGLCWAFLGIPAALLATKIDGAFGKIVLGVVVAPFAVMAFAVSAMIALAPFFARKPSHRLIAAPFVLLIGYALGGWPVAFGYAAAVLVSWAAVEAYWTMKGDKVRLPS